MRVASPRWRMARSVKAGTAAAPASDVRNERRVVSMRDSGYGDGMGESAVSRALALPAGICEERVGGSTLPGQDGPATFQSRFLCQGVMHMTTTRARAVRFAALIPVILSAGRARASHAQDTAAVVL